MALTPPHLSVNKITSNSCEVTLKSDVEDITYYQLAYKSQDAANDDEKKQVAFCPNPLLQTKSPRLPQADMEWTTKTQEAKEGNTIIIYVDKLTINSGYAMKCRKMQIFMESILKCKYSKL